MKTATIEISDEEMESLVSLTEYVQNTLDGIEDDVQHVKNLTAIKDRLVAALR